MDTRSEQHGDTAGRWVRNGTAAGYDEQVFTVLS